MATMIASAALSTVQPRAVHAGVNSVYSVYSLTATLSAGDIIQMCKLPDGARVINASLLSNVNPFAMVGVFNLGTRADVDQFIMSATVSANIRFSANNADGHGAVLDVSDDASPNYTMVELSVAAGVTGTQSGSISTIIQYVLDQ